MSDAVKSGVANATGAFKADGAIGSQFESEGAVGTIGEAVGGPFSSDGAVGKNFTSDGAIGGTVHDTAESLETGTAKNRVEAQESANERSV